MRKSLIVLATLVPLGGFAGLAALAAPALAESHDDDACITGTVDAVAGPIDLEAIPSQPVGGSLSVKGVRGDCGDDDDDGAEHHSGYHDEDDD